MLFFRRETFVFSPFCWVGHVGEHLRRLAPHNYCRTNPKDLRKYLIPGTRCCCPQKKISAKNELIFGVMLYAKTGSEKKIAKINFFLPLPPFLQWIPESRESLPHCLLPPSSVSHAPFCTLLCFQRMMNQGPGIRASGVVLICAIDRNPRVQLIHICMPM